MQNWHTTLLHNLDLQKSKDHEFNESPYSLRKIDIQSVDRFGGGRIGFLKFKAEVKNDRGESLPGSVFLRGASVGMLVSFFPSLNFHATSICTLLEHEDCSCLPLISSACKVTCIWCGH